MFRPFAAAAALVLLPLLVSATTPARAAGADARSLYERGSSAYALGHYDEAAQLFEESFARSNEPALLFNAAQAHRLAGHKARALALYQSFLQVTGADDPHRQEVQQRAARLQAELTQQPAVASALTTTAATPAPAPERPLAKRPWLWATVGGVALAIGLGVGLGVGLTRDHGPSPSLGQLPLD